MYKVSFFCPWYLAIGGAQIIDMMMLVVDVTKGMQTQTAECLIIGEILCNKMIVVLNKVDLLEPTKRDSAVEKVIIIDICSSLLVFMIMQEKCCVFRVQKYLRG